MYPVIRLFGLILILITSLYTVLRQQNSEALPWLAVVSDDGYLYRMNANGEDSRQIASIGYTSFPPLWTADGRWIGFLKNESQVFVHFTRHDGRTPTSILKPIPVYGAMAWSPDGQTMIFQDGFNIYRAASDGTNLVKLAAPQGQKSHMSWSPDGGWIAFVMFDQTSSYNIYLMRPDGSQPHALTQGVQQNYYPVWSPDGQWIAFVSNDSSFGFQLHKIRVDGTDRQQLTRHIMVATFSPPVWSPDGKWIAFGAQQNAYDWNIYRVRSDGQSQEQLTSLRHQNRNPDWSPDGQWIVFQSHQHGTSSIYRMNQDGSELRRLTNAVQNAHFPRWSPRTEFSWNPIWLLLIGLGAAAFPIFLPDT